MMRPTFGTDEMCLLPRHFQTWVRTDDLHYCICPSAFRTPALAAACDGTRPRLGNSFPYPVRAWLPRTQRSQWILVFSRRLRHLDHFPDAAIATHRRIDNEGIGIRIEMLII